MARFLIQGGRRLHGTVTVRGNKNAALPMLAACLLTDEPVQIDNIPLIEDVGTMLAILEQLGVSVSLHGHGVTLHAASIKRTELDPELCRRVRSSILFAGPLAARTGRATLSCPGGDVIGRRRLDTHFEGLCSLGFSVECGRQYRIRRRRPQAAPILLDEASVTATENLVMAAALVPGRSVIFNAACEPHVSALCRMLVRMGASISGIGTNRLTVRGVERLRGGAFRVPPDYVEAASFLAAGALTGGEVSVSPVWTPDIRVIERPFRRLGMTWESAGRGLALRSPLRLRVRNDLGAAIPKVEDGPWPAFPSDLMSIAIVLATQARGTMLFFEKMFESRMYFVDRLIEMGARIVQCDPHRVIVTGPARLHGTHLSSPDIRAGVALLLAALGARGTSTIDNAQSIDRGYERIDDSLASLGADITRVM
jgi:UDP-N-acetylglucosamine 1-carboxyvinyltransferase